MSGAVFFVVAALFLILEASAQYDICRVALNGSYNPTLVPKSDMQLLQVAMNLEYLEAEFFLYSAFGYGLDVIRPDLAAGGPAPRGGRRAALDEETRNLTAQFAFQEIGHLRALIATLESDAVRRPFLELSSSTWSSIFDQAMGYRLTPPFNIYNGNIHFLLACYVIPYVGLTGYVGASSSLQSATAKRLVAGLLGVESGQDAVIRAYLSQHAESRVYPYSFTVGELTARLSVLRNSLADAGGVDDEGLTVPLCLGAEQSVRANILAGDHYSVSYSRTPDQVLSIVYGTGSASCPGSFLPYGAEGDLAKSYLSLGCHQP